MIKKLKNILILFFITSCIAFIVTRIIPGDPRIAYLNTFNLPLTEENFKYIEEKMGLNIPIWQQYYIWLKNILTLNLGKSYINGMDVYTYLRTSLFYTIKLMCSTMILVFISSLFLGVISVLKNNSKLEKLIRFISLIEISSPKFLLGFIFINIFGVKLKLFPISGAYSDKSIVLPTISLALPYIGYYTQFIKQNMLTILSSDFVKYARLRRVNNFRIMIKYVLFNALTPILTSFGKTIGGLLGGTVIIENIFAWPGLGRVIVEAIDGRDYPVIQGYIFLVSLMFIFSTELTNLLCYYINPKLKEK